MVRQLFSWSLALALPGGVCVEPRIDFSSIIEHVDYWLSEVITWLMNRTPVLLSCTATKILRYTFGIVFLWYAKPVNSISANTIIFSVVFFHRQTTSFICLLICSSNNDCYFCQSTRAIPKRSDSLLAFELLRMSYVFVAVIQYGVIWTWSLFHLLC